MQKLELSLAVGLSILIAGCATKYVEPTEGALAQMRFVSYTKGISNVLISSFDSENCDGRTRVGALTGIAIEHFRKKMGLPLAEDFADEDFTEATIPANRPYTYDLSWHSGSPYSGTTSCNVTTTFQPLEGHIYETSFRMESDACFVNVFEIKRNQDGSYSRVPEKTARKNTKNCRKIW